MVKPVNLGTMTITLQQAGQDAATVKPLVVGQKIAVRTLTISTPLPAIPNTAVSQPDAPLAAANVNAPLSLSEQAGLSLHKKATPSADNAKLRDFTREQLELLTNRYRFTRS